MPTPTLPVGAIELPPLPEPDGYAAVAPEGTHSIVVPPQDFAKHNAYAIFTADQMHAYLLEDRRTRAEPVAGQYEWTDRPGKWFPIDSNDHLELMKTSKIVNVRPLYTAPPASKFSEVATQVASGEADDEMLQMFAAAVGHEPASNWKSLKTWGRFFSYAELIKATRTLAAPAPVAQAAVGATVDQMVDRFLCWPLPKTFAPDCGISFDGRKDDEWNKGRTWPVGTNLFTADEAKAMFAHALTAPHPSATAVAPVAGVKL